jgi:hypothetical protein
MLAFVSRGLGLVTAGRGFASQAAALSAVACAALAFGGSADAAQRPPFATAPAKDHEEVALFDAIKEEKVEVRFVPRNAKEATIVFTNKTDKPLAIRMPEALAAAPVLAQFGGGFGGAGGGGGFGGQGGGFGGQGGIGGQGGQNQGVGMGGGQGGFGGGQGGFGGGGGGFGGGGGGFGGGFMNVAAEKVAKTRVETVCLEHGKPDPNPHIEYELRPIDTLATKPEVVELCAMLGRGEMPQNAAQAAAWHLNNDLSWDELAAKDRVHLSNGYFEKFFNQAELELALRATQVCAERAAIRAEYVKNQPKQTEVSPGEQIQAEAAQLQEPVQTLELKKVQE